MKTLQLILTIAISAIAAYVIAVSVNGHKVTSDQPAHQSAYEHVIKTGTLRCGYEFWDGGVMKDPKSDRFSGVWVDILEELAKAAEIKLEWTAHVGWGDVAAALKSGKIDAMCAGMWQSTAKAKEMAFSIPVTYQGIEAFVRSDDHRFDNNVDRINSEDVTVAVVDADTSDFLAKSDFPKAKRMALGQLNGTDNDLFLSLATKKADVTFDSPGLWRQFDKNNPNSVRRIAPGHNLRVFGMSVVVDNDDPRLLNMMDVGAQEILNSGAVDRILKKYDSDYPDMYLKTAKPFSE